jgi:hypothetical protein
VCRDEELVFSAKVELEDGAICVCQPREAAHGVSRINIIQISKEG